MLSLLSPGETCETEASDIVETPVLACAFREVRDATVVRIVDIGRRVSVCRSNLLELFGLVTCGVRGIGQVATNSPPLVRKCAWPALPDRVKSGKDRADRNVVSK